MGDGEQRRAREGRGETRRVGGGDREAVWEQHVRPSIPTYTLDNGSGAPNRCAVQAGQRSIRLCPFPFPPLQSRSVLLAPAPTMMDLKVDEEEVENGQPISIEVFASSSTLHGLSHIFSYERLFIKRIFWTLCFLGSLALLFYTCNERIQYYFRYPHVTKLDEVAASQMSFPAVTFCNLNEFRFSRVTKNDLYHAGELLALLNNRWARRRREGACHPRVYRARGPLVGIWQWVLVSIVGFHLTCI